MGSCPDTGIDPDIFLSSQQRLTRVDIVGRIFLLVTHGNERVKMEDVIRV